MKGRISQSVDYSESDFGLESFAPAVWYVHGTYRCTWVSTHKKSSVKRRRNKSANTLMQTDINSLNLLSHTHAHTTHSQVISVCTLSNTHSACMSVPLGTCQTSCPSVHPLVIVTSVSLHCLLLPSPPPLPFLYPSHTAYHVPTVSLPINAHRAALQWGWRVPRQQAQYRVYRHACTCQPGRAKGGERGRGRGRERAKESEWRICWVRQSRRRCATLSIYTIT